MIRRKGAVRENLLSRMFFYSKKLISGSFNSVIFRISVVSKVVNQKHMVAGNHPSGNFKKIKVPKQNICSGIITFQLQELASIQLQDTVRYAGSQQAQLVEQIFLCCSELFLPNPRLSEEPIAGQATDLLQLGGRKKVPDTLGNCTD